MRARTPNGARKAIAVSSLALFAFAALLASLRFGSLSLDAAELGSLLFGGGDAVRRGILLNIRLPRNLCALMAGAALAVSGTLLQGVMRNPLAAPNLIGVSSGAGAAAMLVLVALPRYSPALVPAAFCGALSATLLIYGLAWKRGAPPTRLILAGIAVSSLLGAFINALMIFFPERVSGVVDFLVGGLSGRTWRHARMMAPYLAVGLAGALALARRLDILALGDESAVGFGLAVERTRAAAIAAAALLAAAAVSVVGLLGFVGLVAPHIARRLVGSGHRALIPAAAFLGGGLLLSCDTLARVLLDPVELPAGIVMSAIGAPFFLYLLRKGSRHGAQD